MTLINFVQLLININNFYLNSKLEMKSIVTLIFYSIEFIYVPFNKKDIERCPYKALICFIDNSFEKMSAILVVKVQYSNWISSVAIIFWM